MRLLHLSQVVRCHGNVGWPSEGPLYYLTSWLALLPSQPGSPKEPLSKEWLQPQLCLAAQASPHKRLGVVP